MSFPANRRVSVTVTLLCARAAPTDTASLAAASAAAARARLDSLTGPPGGLASVWPEPGPSLCCSLLLLVSFKPRAAAAAATFRARARDAAVDAGSGELSMQDAKQISNSPWQKSRSGCWQVQARLRLVHLTLEVALVHLHDWEA